MSGDASAHTAQERIDDKNSRGQGCRMPRRCMLKTSCVAFTVPMPSHANAIQNHVDGNLFKCGDDMRESLPKEA